MLYNSLNFEKKIYSASKKKKKSIGFFPDSEIILFKLIYLHFFKGFIIWIEISAKKRGRNVFNLSFISFIIINIIVLHNYEIADL